VTVPWDPSEFDPHVSVVIVGLDVVQLTVTLVVDDTILKKSKVYVPTIIPVPEE
jgi:hypothetical protein